jgi:hypothetical protein
MKRFTGICLLLMSLCLPASAMEFPTVNLPLNMRQRNWLGDEGEGSCVHATMVMLFRWQGRDDLADLWRKTYGNGESYETLEKKLEAQGVRYAYTTKGDVEFLEWACRTRRGCGVTVDGGAHMVALVHFDANWAGVLDNNQVDVITWYRRDDFVKHWREAHGWAVTPVYDPAPPLPKLGRK